MQKRLVALLAPMLKRGIKAMLKPGIEQVRTIADQLGRIARRSQQAGDMVGSALIDRLPGIMGPPQPALRQIGAVWNGGKATRIKALNGGGPLRRETIERGRADRPRRPIRQIIISKIPRDSI